MALRKSVTSTGPFDTIRFVSGSVQTNQREDKSWTLLDDRVRIMTAPSNSVFVFARVAGEIAVQQEGSI